jgi:hypothetical protein
VGQFSNGRRNAAVLHRDAKEWMLVLCSLSLREKELMSPSEKEWIGPFPSQEEAEKDTRATLNLF